MRPPVCLGSVQQSIWFGSELPSSTALAASALSTTLKHAGSLLVRQTQQSIFCPATRRASSVAQAPKIVIWKKKRNKMQSAAYMQNARKAGSAELTEMVKATKSVTDVNMM